MRKPSRPPTPPTAQERDGLARTYSYTIDGTVLSLTRTALKQIVIHRRDAASANRRERRRMAAIMHSDRIQARVNKAIQRQLDKVERRAPPPRIRVRVEAQNRRAFERKPHRIRSRTYVPLPRYDGPIIDRQGRRGIVMTIDYDGAKRHSFGITGRRIAYLSDPEHCELYANGNAIVFSNMGEDLSEILIGADLVELAQRESRADAKLNVNIVIQMPHDVPQDARAKILKAVSFELFGRHGLPYAASLHEPDPGGDQRNFHGHICGSWRPMTRTAPYCWEVAQDFRSDLDGAPYWRHARRRVAEIMTAVVAGEGLDRCYTHLSNAERGLVHKPQKKLDKRKTRAARAGEFVADVEANRARMEANVALAERLAEKERQRRRRALNRKLSLLRAVTCAVPRRLDLRPVALDRDAVTIASVERAGAASFGAGSAVRPVEWPGDHEPGRRAIRRVDTMPPEALERLYPVFPLAATDVAGLVTRVPAPRSGLHREPVPRPLDAPGAVAPNLRSVTVSMGARVALRSITSPDRTGRGASVEPVLLAMAAGWFGTIVTAVPQPAAAKAVIKSVATGMPNRPGPRHLHAPPVDASFEARRSVVLKPVAQIAPRAEDKDALRTVAVVSASGSRPGVCQVGPLHGPRGPTLRAMEPLVEVSSIRPLRVDVEARADARQRLVEAPQSIDCEGPADSLANTMREIGDRLAAIAAMRSLGAAPSPPSPPPQDAKVGSGLRVAGATIPSLADDEAREVAAARAFVARAGNRVVHVGEDPSGLYVPHRVYWRGNGLTRRGLSDPKVQAELVRMEQRQAGYMARIYPTLRQNVDASILARGSAATVAALPEDEQAAARQWARTGIWPKMMQWLRDEGHKCSRAEVRTWRKACGKSDGSRFHAAAKALRQLEKWPIDIDGETKASLQADARKYEAMLAAQQAASRQAGIV